MLRRCRVPRARGLKVALPPTDRGRTTVAVLATAFAVAAITGKDKIARIFPKDESLGGVEFIERGGVGRPKGEASKRWHRCVESEINQGPTQLHLLLVALDRLSELRIGDSVRPRQDLVTKKHGFQYFSLGVNDESSFRSGRGARMIEEGNSAK